MSTIKRIVIDNECFLLPRPLEVGEEPIDREKVIKALINAWKEDYEELQVSKRELKAFQLLFNKNILNTNNNGIISIFKSDNFYELQILLDKDCVIIPLTKEEYETFKRGITK